MQEVRGSCGNQLFGWVRTAHFLLYEVTRCVTIASEVVTVNKREKLLEILKKYGIEQIRHSADFNPDEDEPSGEILIFGEENNHLLAELYDLYTDYEKDNQDQCLFITILPEKNICNGITERCTEELNANL